MTSYHTFRRRLAIPLVTVELSYRDGFELGSNDADTLIQLHSQDVLWQKERLLNIALQAVPDACDTIAWLDCDVIFQSDDWAESAIELLDRFALIQLFDAKYELPRRTTPDEIDLVNIPPTRYAVATKLASSDLTMRPGSSEPPLLRKQRAWGLAWATRREVLERHGLYDACVLGGGDQAIAWAACGHFDSAAHALRMTGRHMEHYQTWAKPFYNTIGASLASLCGPILHLWHGEPANRKYRERLQALKEFEFDPFVDIAIDNNGAWRWSSNKPEMHHYVRDYFELRMEDFP